MSQSAPAQPTETIRIPAQEMQQVFYKILLQQGFQDNKAARCAEIFTDNSVDGIYTHGINRFARFVEWIQRGWVKPENGPVRKGGSHALEQWDGQLGPGPLNALHATERAMELARSHGIGCVGLSNTNHWMRGGTYGWKAARGGFVFIGWTNTIANMPAWGAVDARLGNNPLVFAIPYGTEAIVMDMALSQYSYGALEQFKMKDQPLPVPGGYDAAGKLSSDPSAILDTRRILPAGYWKGAGLSLLLDLLAAILSAGSATHEITAREHEYAVSQVFIAMDLSFLQNRTFIQQTIEQIIQDYQSSIPEDPAGRITYPGERVLHTRENNLRQGVPVDKVVWDTVQKLS
ncbi:MAG: 3-dehydro-L-gulonate 2-dehydrogenase [Williamsia sp.]|nr:3-dehydro-L-gulonate 2-dehydrogenase [Williamsia sp.]